MPDSNSACSVYDADDFRRSAIVFTGILLLVLLAVAFPEMATQGLLGILWTGVGLLMLLFPPVVRLPRLWIWLAAGFVVLSMVGFLPRGWFHVPSWRTDLEALDLDTGGHAFVQPKLAAETAAGFVVTALVALFLLGHRIDSRCHHRLALVFALGVGAWTAVALIRHEPTGSFGFFPNRNHSATLLAMGTFAGFGSLAHAIRRKDPWKIGLSVLPTLLCLYALFAVSISRAGVVLVIVGFGLWILLTGFKQLHGNVGKALVLVVIAVFGYFLIVDSTAKKRLTSTVDRVVAPGPDASSSPENPFTEGEVFRLDSSSDGRITIFQDTVSMILKERWTGVGPGQFALVFPQYREKTTAPDDSRCLHPESDWLMMLAEVGWPATLSLAAGLFAVVYTAVRQIKRGRSRFLRIGCLVGALLLLIHGIFDVPGHRIGVAWAGVMLLAASLRHPAEDNGETKRNHSAFGRSCWRVLGGMILLAGAFLIHAQSSQRSVLPSVQVRQAMADARKLYDQDQDAYDRAVAEGREYEPKPWEDPLEVALLKMEEVIDLSPLDPYPHYVQGSLALHYDDKPSIVSQAFAMQRRLDPRRVNVAMEQARAWSKQDSREVMKHWREALQRASLFDSRFPDSPCRVVITYQGMLKVVGSDDSLGSIALEVAGNDSTLWIHWVRSAPAAMLDRELPRLLAKTAEVEVRKQLFEVWAKRGSKGAAANFAKSHPELGLGPP